MNKVNPLNGLIYIANYVLYQGVKKLFKSIFG